MTTGNRFEIVDFVVFAITVIVSLAIGIYYAFKGGGQKTTSDYLLGGRLVSFFPVAISLLVSFESSIMMLGIPAEGYVYGIQFILASLFYLMSQLLAAYVVPPMLHPLNITSAYEYLELRFNSRAVRMLGTVGGMLSYCFYMGIVLFGPSVALEAVTGFPQWISIVVISLVAVIYTSIGGLKAVIWTDVFQAVIMLAGILGILIKGTMEVGGPKQVWDLAEKGGRLNFFVFDTNPRTRHTFFNLFISTFFRGFGMTFNQSSVQRISSTNSQAEARKVLMLVAPCFAITNIIATYEGIVAYAYYQVKGCDPFESQQLTDPNQIIPFFVMDLFKNVFGMPGLFLASLFSASMSTLSSGLSSMSALLWADFIKPVSGNLSDLQGTVIAKFSVLVFGAIACGLAFLVSLIGGTLNQIAFSLLAAFGGPVVGLFLSGIFFPRITSKGAFWGCILSLAITSWIAFGMNFSSAVKPTPYLPPASMDKCYLNDTNLNTSLKYFSYAAGLPNYYTTDSGIRMNPHEDINKNISKPHGVDNNLDNDVIISSTPLNLVFETTEGNQNEIEPTGMDALFTMSYTFISPFGTVSSVLFSLVISFLTGCNKPGDVDPRYLLGITSTWLFMFPKPIKHWISSRGPQFMKEEYKDKFQDPALRHKGLNQELTVLAPEEKVDLSLPKFDSQIDTVTELDTYSIDGTTNLSESTILVTAQIGVDDNINTNSNGKRPIVDSY